MKTHTRRIRDDADFLAFVEYIRRNPEKQGLQDWPFVFIASQR